MYIQSCSTMTAEKRHPSSRYSISCACVNCQSLRWLTIELKGDGTASAYFASDYALLKSWHFNSRLVPTSGESVLIWCDTCGRGMLACRLDRRSGGTSFTLQSFPESYRMVTKDSLTTDLEAL